MQTIRRAHAVQLVTALQRPARYVRYHQAGRGGVGFSLYWNHAATDAHIERIATLISGSLWSSATGAPFTNPFNHSGPVNRRDPFPSRSPVLARDCNRRSLTELRARGFSSRPTGT